VIEGIEYQTARRKDPEVLTFSDKKIFQEVKVGFFKLLLKHIFPAFFDNRIDFIHSCNNL
jgi:hypothetical protein